MDLELTRLAQPATLDALRLGIAIAYLCRGQFGASRIAIIACLIGQTAMTSATLALAAIGWRIDSTGLVNSFSLLTLIFMKVYGSEKLLSFR